MRNTDSIRLDHLEILRRDKATLTAADLPAMSRDVAYWQTKTPDERLEALEIMRQIFYNYDPETARMEKTITVLSWEEVRREAELEGLAGSRD